MQGTMSTVIPSSAQAILPKGKTSHPKGETNKIKMHG